MGCPARHQLTTKDMDTYPQYANFLSDFKRERRWLVWRSATRNGKSTKIPHSVYGGPGSSTNAATWASYEEAVAEVGRYDGLGFAVGDGFLFVDLDGCRHPQTGTIETWASDIVSLLDAPTEVSPSATGLHVYLKSKSARSLKRMFGTGENKRGIEVYCSGRYAPG